MGLDLKKLPMYIWDDILGKDENPKMTLEEGMTYRWIIAGLCLVGMLVTWPAVIPPIVFGCIAFRKVWINLHKMGYIPFG